MTLLTLTPKRLFKAVERTLIRGLVPYIQGSPGVGKSDIGRQIANKWKLEIIDSRLSTMMPEDLNGLPFRNGNKAEFLPFSNFPIEGDELPEGKDGWLIMFDELSSAQKTLQAAAYKIILDREVGKHKLHDKVMIIAAGNKKTDKAVVVPMSTAMQSRLVHFEITVSKDDWIEWADTNGIDYRVKAYINYKPSDLWKFDPDHQENTFPCPRTWKFVSDLIKDQEILDDIDRYTVAGSIGEGTGATFTQFCKIAQSTPSIENILKDPFKTHVPSEASLRFFITSSLIDHVNKQNIENIFNYLERFPEEYQVVFLRGAARKDINLRTNSHYLKAISRLIRFINAEEKDEYQRSTA